MFEKKPKRANIKGFRKKKKKMLNAQLSIINF